MARLIPKTDISQIEPLSERDVARALVSGLDDTWTLFHSYSWLRSPSAKLLEGEADFVMLHPQFGMLIVEVKGGAIRYPGDQVWVQSGRDMKQSPFEQARKNMHALESQVLERTDWKQLPCPFGYAVVFPDCEFSGTLPPGVHQSIIAGARDSEPGRKTKTGPGALGNRPSPSPRQL